MNDTGILDSILNTSTDISYPYPKKDDSIQKILSFEKIITYFSESDYKSYETP